MSATDQTPTDGEVARHNGRLAALVIAAVFVAVLVGVSRCQGGDEVGELDSPHVDPDVEATLTGEGPLADDEIEIPDPSESGGTDLGEVAITDAMADFAVMGRPEWGDDGKITSEPEATDFGHPSFDVIEVYPETNGTWVVELFGNPEAALADGEVSRGSISLIIQRANGNFVELIWSDDGLQVSAGDQADKSAVLDGGSARVDGDRLIFDLGRLELGSGDRVHVSSIASVRVGESGVDVTDKVNLP